MYVFDEEANRQARPVYQHLIAEWVASILTTEEANHANWLKYAWFFFGITAKSLSFHILSNRWEADDSTRSQRVSPEFIKSLADFIEVCADVIHHCYRVPSLAGDIPHFNVQLGYFFCDLLRLIDRGIVFELVRLFLGVFFDKI